MWVQVIFIGAMDDNRKNGWFWRITNAWVGMDKIPCSDTYYFLSFKSIIYILKYNQKSI
jgi:hypothetical protein